MREPYKKILFMVRNYIGLFLLGLCGLGLLIGGYFIDYKNLFLYLQAQDNPTIEYDGENFNPEKLVVFKGTKVTFRNLSEKNFWPASNIHPINALYMEFNAGTRISPGESWSFVFKKVGEWDYHDHLKSSIEGEVIVIDKHLFKKNNGCLKISELSYGERQVCWYFEMKEIIDKMGINKAFDHLTYLYSTEPTFASGCHDVTHLIGEAAYKSFAQDKKFKLEGDTYYCGYGYYHGFIEAMLFSTKDYAQAQELCEDANDSLQSIIRNPNATHSCYHGMGHVMFDLHDPNLWGDEERMIEPALDICEQITEGLGDEKKKQCATGIFNALGIAYSNNQYDLKMNSSDPVWVCRNQPDLYKGPCFMEVSISWIIKNKGKGLDSEFGKAAAFVNSIGDSVGEIASVFALSSEYTRIHRSEFSEEDMIEKCNLFVGENNDSCIFGVVLGLIHSGLPGEEFKDTISFCENGLMSGSQRKACFGYFLPRLGTLYSDKKAKEICALINKEYRHLCE